MKLHAVPVVIISIWVVMSACSNHQVKHNNNLPAGDTAKYYPLSSFFEEQMRYVDLRNFPISKVTVKDGKKDSIALNKDQFLAMAALFLQRSLSEPGIKALYRETVFQDQSTGSLTLNYTPVTDSVLVKNIDILLDDETHIVKRVFIRSAYNKGDTTITEQYNWKANKSFQLNQTLQAKNGFTSTETNFVNWNDTP